MTMTDPIADMLTRIRNAVAVRHDQVTIPASKMKLAIAKVLKDEGFIRDYDSFEEGPRRFFRVQLNYTGNKEPLLTGLKRVSRPGLRVYVQKREIPRVFNGLGIAILSTPKGIMAGQQAWRQRTGGEVLCYVW
ncbi:MAG: 30S ribosomal protein S8 [Chloroflexi bacterium]|nr:30S ribosomal protein S8 [Chloroflexota bacterium]MCI0855379.1 30S ribosomal protein S8 [Chloroflexota bacterium]MCI0889939.1 30S ribosomal protein S8 [Chloroflexota bacterium]